MASSGAWLGPYGQLDKLRRLRRLSSCNSHLHLYLYCTALYCTALYCTAFCMTFSCCIWCRLKRPRCWWLLSLCGTALYCTTLHIDDFEHYAG